MASKNGAGKKKTIEVAYEEQDDPFDDITPLLEQERSAPHQLVREFVSEDGIEGKTNLSKKQVAAFTRLDIFHRDFPEFEVDNLKHYLLLKISEDGKSRDGLLGMLKGNVGINPNTVGPAEMKRGGY